MASQDATNEAIKQINLTLHGYSSHFAEIKTSMTDLKSSVDEITSDMANFTTKFQEFEMYLDITVVKVDELEYQVPADHRVVIKHELEALAKILRIQNELQDKVIYILLAEFFALILKITPREMATWL